MCEHQTEIIEELRWVMMELSGDVLALVLFCLYGKYGLEKFGPYVWSSSPDICCGMVRRWFGRCRGAGQWGHRPLRGHSGGRGTACRGVAPYGDLRKTPKECHRKARRHLRHWASEAGFKVRGQVGRGGQSGSGGLP